MRKAESGPRGLTHEIQTKKCVCLSLENYIFEKASRNRKIPEKKLFICGGFFLRVWGTEECEECEKVSH